MTIIRAVMLVTLALSWKPVSANELSPETDRLVKATLDPASDLQSSKARADFVGVVQGYCDGVQRAYPKNSPSEDAWLEGEVKAGGERTMRVLRSAEFGRRMASNFTTGCAAYGKMYLDGSNRNLALAGLGYTFTQFSSDAQYFANINKVSTDRFALPVLRAITERILLVAILEANPPR